MDDLTNMFADTTGAVDAVELPSAFMDDTEGGRIFQSELDQLYAISVEPFRSPEPFRMQLQPAALVVEEHSAMATEAAPGFQGTAYVGYATSIQHQGMTAEMHPAGTAVGEPSTMFTNVAAGTGVPGVHYASYVQHQPMMLDLQQGHAFGEDPFGMGTGVAAGTGAAAGLHYPAFQHQPMMLQTQPEAALVGEPSSMLTNAVTGFDASAYLRYAASLRHPLFADQNSGQAVDLQHHLQNISPAIGGIGQPVFVPGGAVPVAETNGAPPMQVMTQGPYAISAIILPELETPMIRVPPEYPAPGGQCFSPTTDA